MSPVKIDVIKLQSERFVNEHQQQNTFLMQQRITKIENINIEVKIFW